MLMQKKKPIAHVNKKKYVQQYIAFFVSKRFLDAVSKFVNESLFFYSKTKSHLPL